MPAFRTLFATLALAGLLGGCGEETPTLPPPPPPPGGPPALPASQIAWLKQALVPLSSTSPSDDLSDLEPLRAIVGNARIVALGEATHGTREFFTMKHRILRFLVTQMGFNAFAIEATWPESNRLDRYVRTGVGSADSLLSGLYFWTWNTAEVLEQIEWMRGYNAGGGSLGFYGFDMQFPGMALENLRRFVLKVDPASEAQFGDDVACLRLYANTAQGGFSGSYSGQSVAYRTDCGLKLLAARQRFQDRRVAYTAASSAQEFGIAAQSIELALQYHNAAGGGSVRDSAMAENAGWVLDHLGPTSKVVLWAHNGHIASVPGAMGQHLRQKYGANYIRIGFAFGTGSFNAVPWSFTFGRSTGPLRAHTVRTIVPGSYEHYFSSAGVSRFLLDLRARQAGGDSVQWLAGPRLHRTVGAAFDAGAEHFFWIFSAFPAEYDAVIYLQEILPSLLLPFKVPAAF